MSLNKAMLIGNLGKDADEVGAVIRFTLATTERRKDGNRTEWHNVSLMNEKLGQAIKQYLKSGALVYVEGKIITNRVERDGVTKFYTNIQVGPYDGTVTLLGGSQARSDSNPVSYHSPDTKRTHEAPAGRSVDPFAQPIPRGGNVDPDDDLIF